MMKEETYLDLDNRFLSNHVHPYPILSSRDSSSSHNSVDKVDIKLKKKVHFEEYSHVYYFGRTLGQSTVPIQGLPLGMEKYHFHYSYEPIESISGSDLYDLKQNVVSVKRNFQYDPYQRKQILEQSTGMDFFQLLSSSTLTPTSTSTSPLATASAQSTSTFPFDSIPLSTTTSFTFFDYNPSIKEEMIGILKDLEIIRKSRSELPLCSCSDLANSMQKCGDPSSCYCAYHQIDCHDWCICKSTHSHNHQHKQQQQSAQIQTQTQTQTRTQIQIPTTFSNPSYSSYSDNEIQRTLLSTPSISSPSPSTSSVLSVSCSPVTVSNLTFEENYYALRQKSITAKRSAFTIRLVHLINIMIFAWLFMNSFQSIKGYFTTASPEL